MSVGSNYVRTMPRLIGICGAKYHGKDTIAKILQKNYGYKIEHFADPLKEVCKSVFGFSEEQLNGDDKERVDAFWGVSPRYMMQRVGTELFRNELSKHVPYLNNDIWLIAFKRRYCINDAHTVVADVRFDNEYDYIKDVGGLVIKVVKCPKQVEVDYHTANMISKHISLDLHQSESNSIGADYIVFNNGTIEELEEKIKKIIEPHGPFMPRTL